MRLFNLFPWRFLVRRIARRKGFLDPIDLVARLRRFAQPSEVQEPIELIRAGMVFHARGLVNTKVIQHNLDWVWPYWIVRQFSPEDTSFIPRAFSFSHVNLTHRNWTAVGVPGCLEMPIVDPRGMVTPHHDDWSIDHWFIAENGECLFPSHFVEAEQRLITDGGHTVETRLENAVALLELQTEVHWEGEEAVLHTTAALTAKKDGRYAVTVRPCNPEGIQFIETIEFSPDHRSLEVDGKKSLLFGSEPEQTYVSDYRKGDVLEEIRAGRTRAAGTCEVGLASGAAVWTMKAGTQATHSYRMPIRYEEKEPLLKARPAPVSAASWTQYDEGWTRLNVPDERFTAIYDSSRRTLALLSQADILPGPYTYRRFWFRDACLIANALLGLNQSGLVRRALDAFPQRQHLTGYFHSQEGEWDSNGQVLWLARQFESYTGNSSHSLPSSVIVKAARWIDRKRRTTLKGDPAYKGLLPAGFSAEHLGPNDFYYWDDFWGVAGMRAAVQMLRDRNEGTSADEIEKMADAFEADIRASIDRLDTDRLANALPAAPKRRMDSGAVGSLVADYPLRIEWLSDERISATADWLYHHSFHKGGFFQNMIHSGINAYLTLDIAQTFLRINDPRYWELIEATAAIASPTGKWPEAVHPHTEGGCMGDGEHAWAAAEWCQMIRALFIEETNDHLLTVGKGLPAHWLKKQTSMSFGPTLTRWGRVSVEFHHHDGKWNVNVEGQWHGEKPEVKVCLQEDEAVILRLSQSS